MMNQQKHQRHPRILSILLTMQKFGLLILAYQLSLLQLILQNMNALELQARKNTIIYVVTISLQEDEKNTKSVI